MKSIAMSEGLLVGASARLDVGKVLVRVAGVGAFACCTALSAQIRIPLPFTPVPVTGQTLSVLLSGIYLGSACGLTSQALYVMLGILGMPFFAGGDAGIAVLLGPTGGYLLGFVVASGIMGVARSARRPIDVIAALLLATATIYFLGAMHLALFLKANLLNALWLGVMPFVPGDAIKMAIAFYAWHRLNRSRR